MASRIVREVPNGRIQLSYERDEMHNGLDETEKWEELTVDPETNDIVYRQCVNRTSWTKGNESCTVYRIPIATLRELIHKHGIADHSNPRSPHPVA